MQCPRRLLAANWAVPPPPPLPPLAVLLRLWLLHSVLGPSVPWSCDCRNRHGRCTAALRASSRPLCPLASTARNRHCRCTAALFMWLSGSRLSRVAPVTPLSRPSVPAFNYERARAVATVKKRGGEGDFFFRRLLHAQPPPQNPNPPPKAEFAHFFRAPLSLQCHRRPFDLPCAVWAPHRAYQLMGSWVEKCTP